MFSHHATASSDNGPQATSIHFHPACKDGQPVSPKRVRRNEAYLAPDFDQAEVLIAQGVNSARVAISDRAAVNDHDPGYSQVAGELQLVPTSPFTFDESILGVLPIYNERANLEALVTAIGQYLVTDIVIVDASSPDGTGELVDQLSAQHPHVHVLHWPR